MHKQTVFAIGYVLGLVVGWSLAEMPKARPVRVEARAAVPTPAVPRCNVPNENGNATLEFWVTPDTDEKYDLTTQTQTLPNYQHIVTTGTWRIEE